MWKAPHLLIASTLVLMALGIVMLASTSGIRAAALYDDPLFFVKRQAAWLLIAILAGASTSRFDYHRWRGLAVVLFIAAAVLLALVLIPGIGVKVGGSRRWLHLGPLGFQPSEFGKFAMIIMLARWLSSGQRRAGEFLYGALIPSLFIGLLSLLIFLEPDFGTALLLAAVGMPVMLLAGTRITHICLLATPALAAFCAAVLRNPLRMRRIFAFLDPELYAQSHSFQLINALYAFAMGGGRGVGLGRSMQKHYYLPEAHTDFIFAIIGEELGAGATLGVLFLFAVIFACGLRISARAPDMFGRLTAFGVTIMITAQAMINIAVVTGCLPTKGLPLPFISFGGSCLLIMAMGAGVLVNIGKQGAARFAENDIRGLENRLQNF